MYGRIDLTRHRLIDALWFALAALLLGLFIVSLARANGPNPLAIVIAQRSFALGSSALGQPACAHGTLAAGDAIGIDHPDGAKLLALQNAAVEHGAYAGIGEAEALGGLGGGDMHGLLLDWFKFPAALATLVANFSGNGDGGGFNEMLRPATGGLSRATPPLRNDFPAFVVDDYDCKPHGPALSFETQTPSRAFRRNHTGSSVGLFATAGTVLFADEGSITEGYDPTFPADERIDKRVAVVNEAVRNPRGRSEAMEFPSAAKRHLRGSPRPTINRQACQFGVNFAFRFAVGGNHRHSLSCVSLLPPHYTNLFVSRNSF
jgi:hypothetical protein